MNTTPAHIQAAFAKPHWYAAYTRSRHEKVVAQQLASRSVECFLPLHKTIRRWNMRRAEVELPLFPSYVFVRMSMCERLQVLSVPGLVELVSVAGTPVAVAENQIISLQNVVTKMAAEPYPYLRPGDRVRVVAGPLTGCEGALVRQNGRTRFVVSVDLIMRSVVVNVEACDLELVCSAAVA